MEAKTQAKAQQNEELWWSLLTGENPKLPARAPLFRAVPDTRHAERALQDVFSAI
jgi:hypothetical protein